MIDNGERHIHEPGWDVRERIDLLGLIQRHLGIFFICLCASCVLGAIYHVSAPKVYESAASIFIQPEHSPVFNEQTMDDRPLLDNPIETHSMLIQSPLIVSSAFEQFQLGRLSEFADVAEDQIADHWADHLDVEIPEDDSTILRIAYRGTQPDDCQKIVQAIVSTYETHLGSTSADIGSNITELIGRGKDELLEQLRKQEQEYADFQRTAPLLWKEGEGINLYHERQAEIEEKRKEMLVERSLLRAKLENVNRTIEEGGVAREAIFYEALIELHLAEDEDVIEREAARGYSLELSREYMDLLMDERQMGIEYGDGHPDLVALRARVEEMKRALEKSLGRSLGAGGASLGEVLQDQNSGGPDYVEIYRGLLAERLAAIQAQLAALDEQFNEEEQSAASIQDYLVRDQTFRNDRDRTEKLFDAVVARLEEINIIRDYGGESMKVIEPPMRGEQIWPSIPLVAAAACFVGLSLGLAWSILLEMTQRVFRDARDIRRALGVPVIGQVPLARLSRRATPGTDLPVQPELMTLHAPQSREAEVFRGIRTSIYFSADRQNLSVIQISSPSPGDGKSTLVSNLAVTTAASGKRVLLLDGDMRRPRIQELFGITLQPGLADVLRDDADPLTAIQASCVAGLDLLPAGKADSDTSELLTSRKFDELLDWCRDRYEVVYVDSPPVLAVSDACVIAAKVDGVVLAIRIRRGVRIAAARAVDMLRDVEANLMGTIVNGIPMNRPLRLNGYGYGYGYGGGEKYGTAYGLGYEKSQAYFHQQQHQQNGSRPAAAETAAERRR